MNSPLARHLTRFHAAPPVAILPPEPEIREPHVTLDVVDLEERLAAARDQARAEARSESESVLAAFKAEQGAAVAAALATARAEWVADGSAAIAASLDAAMAGLRDLVCGRLADVLRPLLSEIVVKRAVADLSETLDRLLADPARPLIKLRGPADLIDALRTLRGDASGLDYETSDGVEITMTAEASYVETQVAAALLALSTAALL